MDKYPLTYLVYSCYMNYNRSVYNIGNMGVVSDKMKKVICKNGNTVISSNGRIVKVIKLSKIKSMIIRWKRKQNMKKLMGV